MAKGRKRAWQPVRCGLVKPDRAIEVLELLLAEVAKEDVQVLLFVLEQRLARL